MNSDSPATVLTKRFDRAAAETCALFAGTTRKGTDIPYMSHLLAVTGIVLEHGGTEDQAIAALLHDAAEDFVGEERLVAIEAEYGPEVAAIVRACSDSLPDAGAEKDPWWERKVEYIDDMRSAPEDALLVSAADKLHNCWFQLHEYHERGEELWDKFNQDAGRQGTLWYYRRLAGIFKERLRENFGIASRLEREVWAVRDAVQAATGDGLEAEYKQACKREKDTRAKLRPEEA